MDASELKDKLAWSRARLDELNKNRSAIDAAIETVTDQINELQEQLDFATSLPTVGGQYNPINTYTVEELPTNITLITKDSSHVDKYELFLSLFEGRPDVHARRFQSRKGNQGYAPYCLNWYRSSCPKRSNSKARCKDCEYQDFSPITYELFVAHASGKQEDGSDVLGAYALDEDGFCRFIVADFDDEQHGDEGASDIESRPGFESMRETAVAFYETCLVYEIPVHLEVSRSGHGIHVWLFFSERVLASKARQLFSLVLTAAMERYSSFNMAAYDQFVPRQDMVPKGGFGNLIALPLQGRAAKSNRSVFVDEELRVFTDQMEYLSRIRKLSAFELEEAISRLSGVSELGVLVANESEEEIGKPWDRKKAEPALLPNDFYGPVHITHANMLHIDKTNLSPRALNVLRRLAAFKNPQFYDYQRMRLPTWNTPRIISTSVETADYLSLPRGAREELLGVLNLAGADYEFEDITTTGTALEVEFRGALRDEQSDAAEALLKHDTGVLSATTGFGKTVIGAYLIASRKVNTLVLVHSQQLLEQWKQALSQFLEIGNEPATRFTPKGQVKTIGVIGEYGGGKKHCSFIVDVAMMQSLNRGHEVPDFVKDYGMVIVDECHHVPAASFEPVLKQVNARYVYGLTATPTREDGLSAILYLECGPIRYKVDAKAQAGKRPFEHYLIPRFTTLQITSLHDEKNALSIWSDLAVDEQRNALIIKDVVAAVRAGRHPLVLSERTEHVKQLAKGLSGTCDNVVTLIGSATTKAKRKALEHLANLPDDEPFVIVANGKYVGEGFDFPRLDSLFLTMPFKSKRMVTQYIGRLHRLYSGKEDVQVYDYVDINVPNLEKQYLQRIKAYKAAGYTILTNDAKGQGSTDEAFIFDNSQFFAAFILDCQNSQRQLVISCPALTSDKVTAFIHGMTESTGADRIVTVFTKPAYSYKESLQVMASNQIARLCDFGARVIESENVRQRFTVVDQNLVWFGSIAPLGASYKDDSIIRVADTGLAAALLDNAFRSLAQSASG